MANDEIELLTPDRISKMSYRTLKLSQVYAETPDRYKARAENARINSLKKRTNVKDGKLVILSVIYTTKDHAGKVKENPDFHYQFIQQLEDKNSLWNSKCKVSCSCMDFLFVDEVSLFKRANSDIYFSNGELPVVKNPRLHPQVCKHLIKLIRTVRTKGW